MLDPSCFQRGVVDQKVFHQRWIEMVTLVLHVSYIYIHIHREIHTYIHTYLAYATRKPPKMAQFDQLAVQGYCAISRDGDLKLGILFSTLQVFQIYDLCKCSLVYFRRFHVQYILKQLFTSAPLNSEEEPARPKVKRGSIYTKIPFVSRQPCCFSVGTNEGGGQHDVPY